MKTINRIAVLVGSAGLLWIAGCSHTKEVAVQPEVSPAAAQPKTADRDYLAKAESDINALEAQVNHLRDTTSGKWRKYHGKRTNVRALVNSEYRHLAQAREDLRLLRSATGNDVDAIEARLNSTLAQVREALKAVVAE